LHKIFPDRFQKNFDGRAVLDISLGLLIWGWILWSQRHDLPSFDGALNFELARNLSESFSYSRYDGSVNLVQTNSVFIYSSALLIKFLGTNTFPLVLASGLYSLLLTYSIARMVNTLGIRRSFAAVNFLLYLGVIPLAKKYMFGGYGEFAGLPFVFLGFLYLVESQVLGLAQVASKKYFRLLFFSGFLIGVAVSIKWVFFLAAIAGGVTLSLFKFLNGVSGGHRLSFLKAKSGDGLLSYFRSLISYGLGFGSSLLIYLALRMIHFDGSLTALTTWLRAQRAGIARQGGASDVSKVEESGTSKIIEHLELIASYFKTNTGSAALFCGAAAIILIFQFPSVLASLRCFHGNESEEGCADVGEEGDNFLRTKLISLAVLVYGIGHLSWWLWLTPTAKAWDRRVAVALVSLTVAILLLIVTSLREWQIEFWQKRDNRLTRIDGWVKMNRFARVVLFALCIVCALSGVIEIRATATWPVASGGIRLNEKTSEEWSAHLSTLEAERARGTPILVAGWEASPRSSLFSGFGFQDVNDESSVPYLLEESFVVVGEPHSKPKRKVFEALAFRDLKKEFKSSKFMALKLATWPVKSSAASVEADLSELGTALYQESCNRGGENPTDVSGITPVYGSWTDQIPGWLSTISHHEVYTGCSGDDLVINLFWPKNAERSQVGEVVLRAGECVTIDNFLIKPGEQYSFIIDSSVGDCDEPFVLMSILVDESLSDHRQLGVHIS